MDQAFGSLLPNCFREAKLRCPRCSWCSCLALARCSYETPESSRVALSPGPLSQPTGYYIAAIPKANVLSTGFASVVQNFTSHSDIVLDVDGCRGVCTGTLIAPSFDISWGVGQMRYNLTLYGQVDKTVTVGSIEVAYNVTQAPGIITVSTMYKSNPAPAGVLTQSEYMLQISQVKNPVQFNNDMVTLQHTDPSVNYTVVLQQMDRDTEGHGAFLSRLGGISLAAATICNSSISVLIFDSLIVQGSRPIQYRFMCSDDSVLGQDSMTWTDPKPFVLGAVREMTFRAAISFSKRSTLQVVNGVQESRVNAYVLRSGFLGAVLAIIVLAIVIIVWIFAVYWHLGRRVSMSPVELANAFRGTITTGSASNREVNVMLKEIGDRKVKYGVVCQGGCNTYDSETRIASKVAVTKGHRYSA